LKLQQSYDENEARRLAALDSFDILDTPREKDFDDVAALASAICQTPIAVVNLIGDGRQFFKAEVGLGVRSTPLESSFCAKAILEQDFLVVPDATMDARFDCNPLVTGEPRLRFYAGALLKTQAGEAVGTVCVLDFRPRDLSPLQEQTLRVLAGQVMKQLELRRALADLARAKEEQQLVNLELGHRIKNMLAVIMSIATQTLRGVTERDAVAAFDRRLRALAETHELLLKEDWRHVPIRSIVERLAAIHGGMGTIEVEGPGVLLGPKAALSVSMILHELATNALKYGALSRDGGSVSIAWRIEAEGAEPTLKLSWRESGGPAPKEEVSDGFGSRLIARGIVGEGGVEKRMLQTGLAVEFSAPLAAVA